MRAAYLYQGINLLVGILMVPMLLRFLNMPQFIEWAIFTTFAGITLQVESSIQTLSVRHIAREYHRGSPAGTKAAIAKSRRLYRILASIVALPFLLAGLGYLFFTRRNGYSGQWPLEWPIFALSYAVNYWFGANNCILLATDRTQPFNYTMAFTRAFNFCAALAFLLLGWGILGMCISFSISVAITCSLMKFHAQRTLGQPIAPLAEDDPSVEIAVPAMVTASTVFQYTVFTCAAYALYRGALLIVNSLFPASVIGPYSLSLQTYGMLTTMALVPIQIWLAPLVKSVVRNNADDVFHEMMRTLLFANGVFAAGVLGLILAGSRILAVIEPSVQFPPAPILALIGAAFLVEVNITILANLLVIKHSYRFVRIYTLCAMSALAIGAICVLSTRMLYVSLVVIPAMIQLCVCVPLIVRQCSKAMAVSMPGFLLRSLGLRYPNSTGP